MRCQDFSPHGQFAPWTFRPALETIRRIRPMGYFAHRRFAPWSWIDVLPQVHGAKCLWANRLWDETCGAKRPWGEWPMASNVHTLGDTYRHVNGANCPWGEVYKPIVTSVSVKEIFQRVADARCLRLGSQSEKLSESLTPYLFIFGIALSNIKYQSLCCRNGVTLMVEITEYGCY